MTSVNLNKIADAIIRDNEKGLLTPGQLALNLIKLLHRTALQKCEFPDHAVMTMRNHIAREISTVCILDSLVCRVLHLLNGGDLSSPNLEEINFRTNRGSCIRNKTGESSSTETDPDEQKPERDLDQKLKDLEQEVKDADSEVAEQLATCITYGDNVLVLGEKEGGFVEDALVDAAADMTDQNGLKATVLRIQPDFHAMADQMAERLRKKGKIEVSVVNDTEVLQALKYCSKVVIASLAMDVDDGPICYSGSSLLATAAYSTKRPVIVGMPRHRILPQFSGCIEAMCVLKKLPENIMSYEESRCEGSKPIVLTGTEYDLVTLSKCDTIVTEHGGYAPLFIKDLIGGLESASDGEDGFELPSVDGDGSSEEDSDENRE